MVLQTMLMALFSSTYAVVLTECLLLVINMNSFAIMRKLKNRGVCAPTDIPSGRPPSSATKFEKELRHLECSIDYDKKIE